MPKDNIDNPEQAISVALKSFGKGSDGSYDSSVKKLPPLLQRREDVHAARRSPHSLELIAGYYLLTDCELYDIPEEKELIIALSSRTYCTLRQPNC